MSKINRIAWAIGEFEGYAEGSVSFRNRNVGNLKFKHQSGTTGQDDNGFAIFRTFEDGYRALITFLKGAFGGGPVYQQTMTLYEFFRRYAPAADSNHPKEYAEFVAGRLGVSPNTTLKELV